MTPRRRKLEDKLKEFAEYVLENYCWGLCDIDGGDIQDKAEELGIIKLIKVDRNDERFRDHCEEYDTDELYFPVWAKP